MTVNRLWYTEGNTALADVSSSAQVAKSLLLALMRLPLGLTTGDRGVNGAPPSGSKSVHFSSCDSSTVSTTVGSGGNLITDVTKVVRGSGGSVRSWGVIRLPSTCTALAVPWYFGWHYNGGSDGTYELFMSKTAPTGGTTTARPTATDEVAMTAALFTDLTASSHRAHLITDALGNFVVLFSQGGKCHTEIHMLAFEGPDADDQFPICMGVTSAIGTRGAIENGTNYLNTSGRDTQNGLHMRSPTGSQIAISAEGTAIMTPGNTSWFTRVTKNQGSGLLDMLDCPVWFYSSSGAASGIRGKLPDWRMVSNATAVGDFLLSDDLSPVREHIITGNVGIPCGGTTLLF